jgi:hypothetical protein
MPRAVHEPVLALRCDDVRRVDGVPLEISAPVVEVCPRPIVAAVGHRAYHHAAICPCVTVQAGGFHQADESPLRPRAVKVGRCIGFAALNVVVHHNAVVHPVFVAHLAHYRRPVAKHGCVDGRQPGARPHVVQRVLYPGRRLGHCHAAEFPVDQVFGAAIEKVPLPYVSITVGGVGAVHVVVFAVIHHTRVVHIGQVP